MGAPSNGFHSYATARLTRALDDAKRLRDNARTEQVRLRAEAEVAGIRAELARRHPAREPIDKSFRPGDRSTTELAEHRLRLIGAIDQIGDNPNLAQAKAHHEAHLAEIERLLIERAGKAVVA